MLQFTPEVAECSLCHRTVAVIGHSLDGWVLSPAGDVCYDCSKKEATNELDKKTVG